MRKQWDTGLIEPRFLGLIHTPEWQAKIKKQQAAKKKKGAKEWDWFAALDRDKDGLVTEEEWLERAMMEAKRKGNDTTVKQQKEYFAGRDANGDGSITREELEASTKK